MTRKIIFCFLPVILFSTVLFSQSTQLTVRGFSEGFYRESTGKMVAVLDSVNSPLICDSGIIGLIDTTTLQSVYCANVLITTDGYGTCIVPSTFNGQKYLISLKFKNTFHLLSKQTIELNGLPLTVDLTIPLNACCSFNTTNGVANIFSGDITGDGAIDVSDYLILSLDIQNNVTGYFISDLNGDHVADSSDFNILNLNLTAGWGDNYLGNCFSTLNEISENEQFSINLYPNPCKDYFTVSLGQSYRKIQFTLIDLLGKTCINSTFEDESTLRFNSSQLHTGIYMIKIGAVNMSEKRGILIVNND